MMVTSYAEWSDLTVTRWPVTC